MSKKKSGGYKKFEIKKIKAPLGPLKGMKDENQRRKPKSKRRSRDKNWEKGLIDRFNDIDTFESFAVENDDCG